jgi:hypothetical protein
LSSSLLSTADGVAWVDPSDMAAPHQFITLSVN